MSDPDGSDDDGVVEQGGVSWARVAYNVSEWVGFIAFCAVIAQCSNGSLW